MIVLIPWCSYWEMWFYGRRDLSLRVGVSLIFKLLALFLMISLIFIPQDWSHFPGELKAYKMPEYFLSRVRHWIRQWWLCSRAGRTGFRTDTNTAGSGKIWIILPSDFSWNINKWNSHLFCDDQDIDFRSSEYTEAIFLSWEDWEFYKRVFKRVQCLQLNVRDTFIYFIAGSSCWDWWRTRQQSQTEP